MVSLLNEPNIKDYDIIAIQEPWRNEHVKSSYNPRSSGFHLAYCENVNTRVCFYINEKIDVDTWTVSYPTADIVSLELLIKEEQKDRKIFIHNVYNPSPISPTSTNSPSSLPALSRCLTVGGEHIVLGDFNLHHPLWGGTRAFTQDAMADNLIDIVEAAHMDLTLPAGTITWEARKSSSTIDLIFMTENLQNKVEHCKINEELNQSFDHKPISTKLRLGTELTQVHPRRAWKSIDMAKTEEHKKHAPCISISSSKIEIDEAISILQNYITDVIENTVPWAKPWKQSKAYWTRDCSDIVAETRRLRRVWSASRDLQDLNAYIKMCDKKKKIISKAKKKEFRLAVAEAAGDRMNIWKIAMWAREKSMLPKEVPKLPTLAKDGRKAETFDEKVQMFKEAFFPPLPTADLTDIRGFTYPEPEESRMEITAEEVSKAITRVKADKAPGPDGIPNRILKILGTTLVERLLPIFNACATLSYHPRTFKEATTIVFKKPGKDDYTDPKAYRSIALLNTMGKILESIMAEKITTLAESKGMPQIKGV